MDLTPTQRQALLKQFLANDPTLSFGPSPVQASFLHSTAPFRCVVGGNRTGKTTANAVDLALTVRGLHPVRKFANRIRVLVLTNTRQQASQVFGRKLFEACELPGPNHDKPLIPKEEVDVSYLKVGLKVPYSAATKYADIMFGWSGVTDLWERLQGLKLDAVYLDEDAGEPKLLDELFMRGLDTRKADPGRPWAGGISWSATPTCGTEAYLKFRKWCQENNPSQSYFFIPAGTNPAVSIEALADARKFLGERTAAMRVDGTKDASELVAIFGEQWNDARHLLPVDATPAPTDNLWLSYDPGVDHPTGMLLARTTADNPLRLEHLKFWNHRQQTLEYDVRVLDEFLCGRRLAGVVYDTAAKNRDKMGTSVLEQFIIRLRGRGIVPFAGFFQAQKNHWPGITLTRHYLDPDPYHKTATPLIGISPSVESGGQLLREQLLRYRGKEATQFTGEGGVVKKDDEGPDCLRYLCCKRPAYNPAWACGSPTRAILAPDTAPVILPTPQPPQPTTPYERHLALSRERKRPGRSGGAWVASEF